MKVELRVVLTVKGWNASVNERILEVRLVGVGGISH